MGSTDPATLEKPTRVRYGVMALLCSLALVLYIDRICIAQAAVDIQFDLGLSNTRMGWVFGSFMLAYGLFEVITGHWGDRYGSRRVLLRIVLWWSAFTALTGCVWRFAVGFGPPVLIQPPAIEKPPGSGIIVLPEAFYEPTYVIFSSFALLLLIRFLFGAGEAGALPNAARIVSRWFPLGQRGLAQSFITTANLTGGALAPILTGYLNEWVGWRLTFVIFGGLGIIWAAAFAWWYRDDPQTHPKVNDAERRLIRDDAIPVSPEHHPAIPWKAVLSSSNTWFLGLAMACAASYAYMLYSWFPSYLRKARLVDPITTSWLAGSVLIIGAVGVLLGGWLTDWLSKRTGSRRNTLRGMGAFGMLMAAPCVAATVHCDSSYVATLLFGAACFGLNIQLAAWWATVADVSGRHIGALFGLMNSLGIFGGFLSQVFLGRFIDFRKDSGYLGRDQWDPAFYLYAGILAVGGLLWLGVNASKPIVPDDRTPVG